LGVAFDAYGRLNRDLALMGRFVVAPIQELSESMETAAQMKLSADAALAANQRPDLEYMRASVHDLGRFLERYRSELAVAQNPSADAVRFRFDLEQAHRTELLAEEKTAMDEVGRSLERISATVDSTSATPTAARISNDARNLRTALRRLLRVNATYVEIENAAIEHRSNETWGRMAIVGLLGLFSSLALGVHVHRAIAPRIRRLVKQVRRFQDLGVHHRMVEEGRDEIAVLANALDTGFAAIAARDRERERFLAVVAHELKTPMTSILGFTELALQRSENAEVRKRALDLVRSHASRLGRLIDDLLLAASARSGALPFRPQPVDPAVLVERVASEVTTAVPGRSFELDLAEGRPILADDRLLTQAVWTLLTYAAAVAEEGRPLAVHLVWAGARLRLEVLFDAPSVPAEEIERTSAPFASVQYEGGGGIRSAVGLFLCREIARVHGGTLLTMNLTKSQRMLVLDLPA
jgi:signal transduction histidine kinase